MATETKSTKTKTAPKAVEKAPEEPEVQKGRFTRVVVSKTVQVGQYEPLRVEVECTVGDGEDIEDVYADTKMMVEYLISKG
jgi:hypothetical protein